MRLRPLLALLGLLLPSPAVRADAEGDALAQRLFDRPQGKDATSTLTMTLTGAGAEPRVRRMRLFRYRRPDGEAGTLLRFTEPADIRGTGLLSLEAADGDLNQWVWLPSLERVRRIEAGRRGGRVVNSDYSFEDLRERPPARDTHRLLGHERLDGAACLLLESVPKAAGDSAYLRRVTWVDERTLMPLRIDYFEQRADTPSKRWLALAHRTVDGYPTVTDSSLTDLTSGHQTRLTVDDIAYDRALPPRLFTLEALEDERMAGGGE